MKIYSRLVWILLLLLVVGCMGRVEISEAETSVVPHGSNVELATPEPTPTLSPTFAPTSSPTSTPTLSPWSSEPNPLQIEQMRQRSYPGSQLTFEQTLEPGANYYRYIVSYLSDGYKVYALMTIPFGEKPETGWPVIIFNHGYIRPTDYRTTERYGGYVDAIALRGYIVFKPDYRGHGDSEGSEVIGGGYGTPGYTDDVLNAIASLGTYQDADSDRIGMWGHSMGGHVTLRAMVVSKDIKAGVIWGGVVTSYPEIISRWDYKQNPALFPGLVIPELTSARSSTENWLFNFSEWVEDFSAKYGDPDENPDFWATISPNSYLAELSGPIQLNHSTTDEVVPVAWSERLAGELQAEGMPYEFYTYEGDDHNISASFVVAMQRSIAFFDQYVKGQ